MEMAREEQRRREAMFNFNLAVDNPNNMGQINPMMGAMAGPNIMGMGGMMQENNQVMALNPSVWSEFAAGGEGGSKRPRYPAEVFGRGGGSSGSNRYGHGVAE
jgi:hypothetical protein